MLVKNPSPKPTLCIYTHNIRIQVNVYPINTQKPGNLQKLNKELKATNLPSFINMFSTTCTSNYVFFNSI